MLHEMINANYMLLNEKRERKKNMDEQQQTGRKKDGEKLNIFAQILNKPNS